MKIGGQIPWNITPICETFKISCLMGRPHTKGVLENLGPITPYGSLVEYHPMTAKDQSRIHLFGKKVLPGLFLGYALYARVTLERWHLGCSPWGVQNDGSIGNLLEKTQCERGDISQRKWKTEFSSRRWTNQTSWRRSRPENIHLDTASTNWRRKSRWFSWRMRRVSTFTTSRLISWCRWSKKWFLVHVRKLYIPPSRWTKSQTLLAERRIILYSTEMHWRLCKKGAPMTIGMSMGQEICLIHGQVSLNSLYCKKKLQTEKCAPGRDQRENSWLPGQIIYGQNSERKWERMPSWRRSKNGHM